MKLYDDKLQRAKGYFEGKIDAVDEETAVVSSNYKRRVCKSFISINPSQIDSRIGGSKFCITKKLDGEMNVLFFDGEKAFIINTGGKVRMGLPCTEEAGKELKSQGIKSAVIPAELYVCEDNGRTRVFDVLSALSKEEEMHKLCLAPFDVLELNGEPFKSSCYEDTYSKLQDLFSSSPMVKPVDMVKAASKSEILDAFNRWVTEENAEGLVIRCDLPLIYKVKPTHTVDALVIGYTEGTGDQKGQIRTLLLALMTDESCYQIVGKTGNGFTDEERKSLLQKLSSMHMDSQYIEADSNHVAFRMVKPELIIELSFNDILTDTGNTKITNPVLKIEDAKFKVLSSVPGISFIYPMYIRIREDKKAHFEDVRFGQITDLIYVEEDPSGCKYKELPKSQVLFREVYKKESKGKLMVLKFMVWKTNKEDFDPSFPAYVMHYTNFSSERKDPLQREIRVSNNKDQILSLAQKFIEENVKKGWVKVG
ncbi:MAG: hypothetical protein N2645_05575 [Clostridia bacterium]|nr:hypothetical protein [Clostridia bacterium]